jgi:hypothetical protein
MQENVEKKLVKVAGVVGSRSLPFEYVGKVGDVTEDLINRGFHIASGGALGTDQFCLERVFASGNASKCSIFSAWQNYKGFPVKVRPYIRDARQAGATIFWGLAQGQEPQGLIKFALLKRNEKLVNACYGLLAFLMPSSRGTLFTISKAVQAKIPVVVFPIGCELPHFSNVKWVPLRCGGVYEGAFKTIYLK